MKLTVLAESLEENKEEKVIESTKISAEQLMPKLNDYKKKLEKKDEDK